MLRGIDSEVFGVAGSERARNQFARDGFVPSDYRPKLIVKESRTPEAVSFQIRADEHIRKLGRAGEKVSQNRLPVCAKHRPILGQNRRKILFGHWSYAPVWSSGSPTCWF